MEFTGASRRGAIGIIAACVCAAAVVAAPSEAEAVRFHVQSRLVGDGYQLITADNEVLNRRRGHVYLGLGLYDLMGDESYNLNFQTLLRFDTFIGISNEEKERLYSWDDHRFALLNAFVQGRRIGGFMDFKVGRFTHADSLDFLMLDGAQLTFNIDPAFLALELIAGLESKHDGNPLTQNQAELDGVRFIKGRTETENDNLTIAVGGAIRLININGTRLRFAYRRLMSGATLVGNSDGEKSQLRTDSEKIGGAFYQRFIPELDLHLNWSYDFYVNDLDRMHARLGIKPTEAFDIDVQYIRQVPVFDTDSIFNIFAARPLNDINTRFRFHLDESHRVYLGGYVRLFRNDEYTQADFTAETGAEAFGASAGWFKSFGWDGRAGVDVIYEGGYGGTRVFVDAAGTWAPLPREFELDLRVTMVYFDADQLENLNAVSGGYQLGARYMIDDTAAFMVLAEHNFNRLQTSQFRLQFIIDFNYIL